MLPSSQSPFGWMPGTEMNSPLSGVDQTIVCARVALPALGGVAIAGAARHISNTSTSPVAMSTCLDIFLPPF